MFINGQVVNQYLASNANDVQRGYRKAANADPKNDRAEAKTPTRTGDEVELSDGARKMAEVYKATTKLKEIPDPREEKINDVLNRLRNGSLVNAQTVKTGIGKMLDSGIVF